MDELTLRKAVEFAVQTEEAGAIFYKKLARRFSEDREISDLFAELAKEEEAHTETFQRFLQEVPEETPYKSQQERLAVLRAMAMSEFYLGEDGLFKNQDKIETVKDALVRAYQLERNTLAYYLEIRELLGASDVIDAIVIAEERHMLQMAQRIEAL